MTEDQIAQVARICHEANAGLCLANGDTSQPPWDEAPDWQRTSTMNGVRFVAENPDAPASANHDAWMAEKVSTGWTWGPVKDPAAKQHPCMVKYDQLPPMDKAKDYVFRQIVLAAMRNAKA